MVTGGRCCHLQAVCKHRRLEIWHHGKVVLGIGKVGISLHIVKFKLEQAMKAQKGSSCEALLFL